MSTLIPPPSQDEIGKALNYYLDGMSPAARQVMRQIGEYSENDA